MKRGEIFAFNDLIQRRMLKEPIAYIMKEKAFDKKIKSEEELETLDDESLINLIFLPGFSTKTEVTDISGRGIGMEAVKSAVVSLQGTMKVTSKLGKKTSYIIDLPYIRNSDS